MIVSEDSLLAKLANEGLSDIMLAMRVLDLRRVMANEVLADNHQRVKVGAAVMNPVAYYLSRAPWL